MEGKRGKILKGFHVKNFKIPDISFTDLMLQQLQQHGDREFLIDAATGKSLTFSELHSLSLRFAASLQKRGFRKQDVIGICLPNILEFPIAFFGAIFCGGIACMITPAYKAREMNYFIEMTQPKFIICTPETSDMLLSLSIHLTFIKEILVIGEADGCTPFRDLLEETTEEAVLPEITTEDDVLMYLATSGTTGLPKACMMTHQNCVSSISISKLPETWDLRMSDTFLVTAPFVHIAGICYLMTSASIGCRVVFQKQFEINQFLQLVQDYKVNFLSMSPPIAVQLVKHEATGKCDFSSVRHIICGAAPLGKDVQHDLMKRTGVKQIRNVYGLTETSCIVVACRPMENKIGSLGELWPHVEGKVIYLHTGEPLGPNLNGEICLRGPTVMKGYLNNPSATAETLDADGWLHTGDVGYYDEEELFYVVDRIKEIIKCMTQSVSPAELEAVLLSHPDVKDAAVIGIPHEEHGEVPYGFVVKQPGTEVTEQQLLEYVASQVTYYKQLRGGVEFVESIPKSMAGKILRKQLQEMTLSNK